MGRRLRWAEPDGPGPQAQGEPPAPPAPPALTSFVLGDLLSKWVLGKGEYATSPDGKSYGPGQSVGWRSRADLEAAGWRFTAANATPLARSQRVAEGRSWSPRPHGGYEVYEPKAHLAELQQRVLLHDPRAYHARLAAARLHPGADVSNGSGAWRAVQAHKSLRDSAPPSAQSFGQDHARAISLAAAWGLDRDLSETGHALTHRKVGDRYRVYVVHGGDLERSGADPADVLEHFYLPRYGHVGLLAMRAGDPSLAASADFAKALDYGSADHDERFERFVSGLRSRGARVHTYEHADLGAALAEAGVQEVLAALDRHFAPKPPAQRAEEEQALREAEEGMRAAAERARQANSRAAWSGLLSKMLAPGANRRGLWAEHYVAYKSQGGANHIHHAHEVFLRANPHLARRFVETGLKAFRSGRARLHGEGHGSLLHAGSLALAIGMFCHAVAPDADPMAVLDLLGPLHFSHQAPGEAGGVARPQEGGVGIAVKTCTKGHIAALHELGHALDIALTRRGADRSAEQRLLNPQALELGDGRAVSPHPDYLDLYQAVRYPGQPLAPLGEMISVSVEAAPVMGQLAPHLSEGQRRLHEGYMAALRQTVRRALAAS